MAGLTGEICPHCPGWLDPILFDEPGSRCPNCGGPVGPPLREATTVGVEATPDGPVAGDPAGHGPAVKPTTLEGSADGRARLRLRFPGGQQYEVESLPLVIGREPSKSPVASLCAPFDNVSRIHAELQLIGGQPHVRDGAGDRQASTNGTFLNGERVGPEPVPLRSGDELRLASDVVIEVANA